jgi:hypothetical protein
LCTENLKGDKRFKVFRFFMLDHRSNMTWGQVNCTELLRTQESKNIIPNGWMQLKPEQEQKEKATLDIEIFGFHVTVNAGTDPELLKKVCNILRSL